MAKNQDLTNAVLNKTKQADGNRKLSCTEAFEIARQFQSEIIEIGRICNRQNIKICKCQLGCFR